MSQAERDADRSGSPANANEQTPLLAPENHQNEHAYWEEFNKLTSFSLPIVGAGLLEFSLPVMSVLSIGHIGTTALAGSTLGTMTCGMTGLSLVAGMASALDTVLPSAWTSPHPELVGVWTQRMTVIIFSLLIPILLIWWNVEPIFLLLNQDPEVAGYASTYLRWWSIALPAWSLNNIMRRYLQAQGLFSVPTKIIVIVAPINAFLNYLLVWGPPSIRLGFIGAPIASAISVNLICILTLAYILLFVPTTAWHPISRRSFIRLGFLTRLGLGGLAEVCTDWWAWELSALIASQLGPAALATNSIALICAATVYQAAFSLGVAASVRIGNLLGEKNAFRAEVACKTAFMLAIGLACITSTLFTVFRRSLGQIFSEDPEVIELLIDVFPIVAAFQVFDDVSAAAGGILRARGLQLVGAIFNGTAYYIIGIPIGAWLAFSRSMGLQGLWLGLTLALIYSAVATSILCLYADWEKEVEKVLKRIEAEEQAKKQMQEGIDA